MKKLNNELLNQYNEVENSYNHTIKEFLELNTEFYASREDMRKIEKDKEKALNFYNDVNLYVKAYNGDIIAFDKAQIIKDVYTDDGYIDIVCDQDYFDASICYFELSPDYINYIYNEVDKVDVYYHRDGDLSPEFHSLPARLVEQYASNRNLEYAQDEEKYYRVDLLNRSNIDDNYYYNESELPEIKLVEKLEELVKSGELQVLEIFKNDFDLYNVVLKLNHCEANILVTDLDLINPESKEELKEELQRTKDYCICLLYDLNGKDYKVSLEELKEDYINNHQEINDIADFFNSRELDQKHEEEKQAASKDDRVMTFIEAYHTHYNELTSDYLDVDVKQFYYTWILHPSIPEYEIWGKKYALVETVGGLQIVKIKGYKTQPANQNETFISEKYYMRYVVALFKDEEALKQNVASKLQHFTKENAGTNNE